MVHIPQRKNENHDHVHRQTYSPRGRWSNKSFEQSFSRFRFFFSLTVLLFTDELMSPNFSFSVFDAFASFHGRPPTSTLRIAMSGNAGGLGFPGSDGFLESFGKSISAHMNQTIDGRESMSVATFVAPDVLTLPLHWSIDKIQSFFRCWKWHSNS